MLPLIPELGTRCHVKLKLTGCQTLYLYFFIFFDFIILQQANYLFLGYINYGMDNLIKILSINSFWKIVFDPLIELNQEIEDIHRDRHRTRSIIKIVVALIIGSISIYYSFNNPKIMEILDIITEIFNFSKESKPFFTSIMDIILCCHIGMGCARTCTRSFCKYYYGDPEFYITPHRLALLEQKIKVHLENITQEEILNVIAFCVQNFNKENSKELGGKKEDWKRTIESLIYDASMEDFYEQQEALHARKLKINTSLHNISENNFSAKNPTWLSADYGSFEPPESELPRTFTLLPQQQLHSNDQEQGIIEEEYYPKITLTLNAFNNIKPENNLTTHTQEQPLKLAKARKSI